MDEVDIEKMLVALKLIVRAYDQEICPFATALIGKLSASYVKLISQNSQEDDGAVDTELALTATGCMEAICNILQSVAEYQPAILPELEFLTENAIKTSLSEQGSE